jgi:membrane protein
MALATAAKDNEPVPGDVWNTLKAAALQWLDHKDAKAGAAIAYYSIFSIGPLIVVVISIASLVFGREGVQAEVTTAIKGLLGDEGAEAVNTMLTRPASRAKASSPRSSGRLPWSLPAIGVVVQLKEALNTVWEVKKLPGKGLWGFVRAYVLSLAGVLAIGFLLLISMLRDAGSAAAIGLN